MNKILFCFDLAHTGVRCFTFQKMASPHFAPGQTFHKPLEIQSTISEFWKPIYARCLQPGVEPPSWQQFFQKYGKHITCFPMGYQPITPHQIQTFLSNKRSAPARLDGWSNHELRCLSPAAYIVLAAFFKTCEREGK